MNRIKINTGLASIILLASLFAGWQTLLLVTVLMFMFCEIDDKVRDVAVKVITFYVGYTIVTTGWSLIMSGVSVVTSGLDSLVDTLNLYLQGLDKIDIRTLTSTINNLKEIANSVVTLLFSIVKLGFIVAILSGKSPKSNGLISKIDEYVNKALNYVNGTMSVNMNMNTSANMNMNSAPQQPSGQTSQATMHPSGMSQPGQSNIVGSTHVAQQMNPVNPNVNNGNFRN